MYNNVKIATYYNMSELKDAEVHKTRYYQNNRIKHGVTKTKENHVDVLKFNS